MYTCECGREIKTKAGMVSHAKACAKVKAFADGVWKIIRPGVYRLLFHW